VKRFKENVENFVRDSQRLLELLGEIGKPGGGAAAAAAARLLDQYQEQPELLDGVLERAVALTMTHLRGRVAAGDAQVEAARALYSITKVRGWKAVVRFMPHEVRDLEPALALLLEEDPTDTARWELRYCLLLWLSIIVLIPFNFATVDSAAAAAAAAAATDAAASADAADGARYARPELERKGGGRVLARPRGAGLLALLLHTCKFYLHDTGPAREAAGEVLARLLSRPDMHGRHIDEFFAWCAAAVRANPQHLFLQTGVLCAVAAALRHVRRDALRGRLAPVAALALEDASLLRAQSGGLRHLAVKVCQRLGLCLLRPRVAKWRYQRGVRSLLPGFAPAAEAKPPAKEKEGKDEEEDEDEDEDDEAIDDEERVASVVQVLLDGLRDRDSDVRWSAAKGVGRVTMALPRAAADDVVGSVLELLVDTEGDAAWHGGCLALAELARRGLLLPARLRAVVPLVTRALVFDVRRGAHSVGAHVRDAACYVCWAFARAYAPEVLQPFIAQLAPQLLAVAVFDREVNCRRAAAAAFQENVGRQGNLPHGIEINTAADYFSLGNRAHAYLRVSVAVARFPEYCRHLVNHLVTVKTRHWDRALRELAARALAELAPADPQFVHLSMLPLLLAAAASRDLPERHGATLAVAETLLRLRALGLTLRADIEREAVALAAGPEAARAQQGRGGSLMREALMRLVECIALAGVALSRETLAQ
jgi:hypothetical protein